MGKGRLEGVAFAHNYCEEQIQSKKNEEIWAKNAEFLCQLPKNMKKDGEKGKVNGQREARKRLFCP